MAKKKEKKGKGVKDGIPQLDAFVITEVMWQYNDEYNYREDDGGSGKPMRVFMNEKRANEECLELNKKQLMHEDLAGFCEDSDSIENAINGNAVKAKIKKSGDYIESIIISPDNDDESIRRFMSESGICFYEVCPVKMDIQIKD